MRLIHHLEENRLVSESLGPWGPFSRIVSYFLLKGNKIHDEHLFIITHQGKLQRVGQQPFHRHLSSIMRTATSFYLYEGE
jgi:hypothetical protein